MDINLIETRRKWIETGQKQNRKNIENRQKLGGIISKMNKKGIDNGQILDVN